MSGGGHGEILESASNPWFIRTANARDQISYCILRSESFPVEQTDLEEIVEKAIQWWRNQLDNAHYPDNQVVIGIPKAIKIKLVTDFQPEHCNQKTDATFQFGFLTSAQKQELNDSNLRRYIGFARQTSYSTSLRGKGYIYIANDRGPDSFLGHNVVPEAWTSIKSFEKFSSLRGMVIHELGHVFGIPHCDQDGQIMSYRAPELLVSNSSVAESYDLKNGTYGSPFIFKFSDVYIGSYQNERLKKFFSIPDAAEDISFKINLSYFSIAFKKAGVWTEVGKAEFESGGKRRYVPKVNIWLPSNQNFLPGLSSLTSELLGPASVEIYQSGKFRFAANNSTKFISFTATPQSLELNGIEDGEFVHDILNGMVGGNRWIE
jgi:hypothetical protein